MSGSGRPHLAAASILAASILIPHTLDAQRIGAAVDTSFSAAPGDTILLGREFILPGTVTLLAEPAAADDSARGDSARGDSVRGDSVRSMEPLREDRDFHLDPRKGILRLPPGGPGAGGPRRHRMRFEHLPLPLPESFGLRVPVVPADTGAGGPDTVYRTAAEFTAADFFGPRLRRSGSLVRGIRAGTNRDVTLNSGFRLEMSGDLTEEIAVAASLTDENTPIQAEGNTQALRELDRVFIELRGRSAGVTLGDLTIDFSEGGFGRLRRKMRGALGRWTTEEGAIRGGAEAGGASVRGSYATNEFRGSDGVQGPYRLRGRDGEFPVIVIAGTERVYVDGREMERGLLRDYTIEYALGELTFTSRRLITAASRIVVEFEHTDRRYERSLAGARARFTSEDGAWSAGVMAIRESDDPDALREGELSPEDRAILSAAGDDPGRAVRSGITEVGPGKGSYELRDTTVFDPALGAAVDTSILVYNPADTARAVYAAVFSFVGPGAGDYARVSSGHYRYAGPGGGSHAPVRALPFAESRTFATAAVRGAVAGELGIEAEYALSSLDRNVLSKVGDGDNADGAYDVALRYGGSADLGAPAAGIPPAGAPRAAPPPDGAEPGGGILGIRIRERRTGAGFSPPERFDEVEFDRNWNAGGARPGRDLLREGSVALRPSGWLGLGARAGVLERGVGFRSVRTGASFRGGSDLAYDVEHLRSDDEGAGVGSRRLRQAAAAGRTFGRYSPRIRFSAERLTDDAGPGGGTGPASFAFTEVTPGISVAGIAGISFSADFGYRVDDSVRSGALVRAAESFLQGYGWTYDAGGGVSSSLELSLRKRRFDRDFTDRRTENTALLRSLTRIAPAGRALQADLFYEANPGQASRPERLFLKVPAGTGSHRYAGDLNGNGVTDEADFRPARYDGDYRFTTIPTDSLFPVLSVRASARVRFDLRSAAPLPGLLRVLAPVSGESSVRIEEQSSDPVRRNVYLLRPGSLRNPLTTLDGSILILQELHLWESDPEFSLRLRFRERKGFLRLAAGDEAVYSREQGLKLRWSVAPDLSGEAELRRLTDAAAADASGRSRMVRGMLADVDWIYRPAGDIEAGFGLGLGDAENYEYSSAALNSQRVSAAWLLRGAGRLRGEFRREEAVVRGNRSDLPFELTQGRLPGTTWIWGCTLEYRLTRFLESSVRYEGRKEASLRTVHAGTMEVRALF